MPCRMLAALICLGGVLAGPAVADDFYAKKTITMIIGGNPGGGYDIYARALARHIPKHIPGEPAIVIQHMPGAGSVNLANHLYARAPKDGLTIGMIFPGRDRRPVARRAHGGALQADRVPVSRQRQCLDARLRDLRDLEDAHLRGCADT